MFFVDVDCGSFFKKRSTVEALRQQFLPEGKSRGIPKKNVDSQYSILEESWNYGQIKDFYRWVQSTSQNSLPQGIGRERLENQQRVA